MPETIEGEAVEADKEEPVSTGLQRVEAPTQLAVTPDVSAEDLVKRLDVIRDASQKAMKKGVDYGPIPGTDRDALLKPGSEKLAVLFQLDIQLENEKVWAGEHLTVVSSAIAYHAPTGTRLGAGEGLCSTYEKKYAYRKAERVCPECSAKAVIKGKEEYGGGWLCWKKKDGCGTTWGDDTEQAKKFAAEKPVVDNPEIPDTWNTVIKMAEKRARVDAVLSVTGASALFTQDIDEQGDEPKEQPPPFGAPASEDLQGTLARALGFLFENAGASEPEKRVATVVEEINAQGDYIPQAAAAAVILAVKELRSLTEGDKTTDEPAEEPEKEKE